MYAVIHQHGTEMLNNDDHTQAERLAITSTKNYQYCIECLRIGIAVAEAAGDHRKAEKLQEQYDRLVS